MQTTRNSSAANAAPSRNIHIFFIVHSPLMAFMPFCLSIITILLDSLLVLSVKDIFCFSCTLQSKPPAEPVAWVSPRRAPYWQSPLRGHEQASFICITCPTALTSYVAKCIFQDDNFSVISLRSNFIAKAFSTPPAELVVVARSSYPTQKPPRLPLRKPGRFVCFIGAFSSAHAITCGGSW